MKRRGFSPIFLGFSIFTGCASLHPGRNAWEEPESPGDLGSGIGISVQLVGDLSSEYFGFFEFTFLNKTDEWKSVEITSVTFDSLGPTPWIRFPSGDTVLLWREAMGKILELEAYNRGLGLGMVGALGITAATLGSRESVRNLGAGAALLAAGVAVADGWTDAKDSLERIHPEPDGRLLGAPITLLPGLFAKRWLLVNSSRNDSLGFLETLTLRFKESGNDRTAPLRFRKKGIFSNSAWQGSLTGRATAGPWPSGAKRRPH